MNNWPAWVMVALVALYVGYQQWWIRKGVTHVSVHDIKAALDARRRFFLVDVREPLAYEAGHIPGAINIPLERLEQEAAGWDREREILVVDGGGRQSVMACRRLLAIGFTRAMNVDGGMRRWPWGTV